MAIFKRQEELQIQQKPKNFNNVKGGLKRSAMTLLGYNSDGSKNTFGKYFGHGNVAVDYYAPKALAKGTDSEDVIESSKGEQWGEQKASFDVAKNFIGGGGGKGAGKGMMSKFGGMFGQGGGGAAGQGTKAGNFTSGLFGGSGGSSIGAKGSKMSGVMGESASENGIQSAGIEDVQNEAAMDSAKQSLEDGIADVNADDYDSENGFISDEDAEFDEAGKLGKSTKPVSKLPILGDIAKSYQAKFATADKLKNTRNKMMTRRESNNNIQDLY